MIIANMLDSSVIDYPGRMSAVVFTAGCNFSCPFCHNPQLVDYTGPGDVSEEQVFDLLESRKGFLDAVVVTGGEPTLHADLPNFLARIKALGLAVKLDTNGSRPGMLSRLLSAGLVDRMAMDIKTLPENYPCTVAPRVDPADIRKSIRLIKESGVDHEFRTTCSPDVVDNAIVTALGPLLSGAKKWVFQTFRDQRVLKPETFQRIRARFTDRDLAGFASLAAKWVERAEAR
ncbi:MAG: anaerobic ribonucleoside-triphosphate reductase activating protein [Proteobacteria bacterium]|nr:anaerobic ribonucleoside-triphosphate reductase activating protein [Pseudomonadota bacterium]